MVDSSSRRERATARPSATYHFRGLSNNEGQLMASLADRIVTSIDPKVECRLDSVGHDGESCEYLSFRRSEY